MPSALKIWPCAAPIAPGTEGTFLQWMKERAKLGGQHKVPRLANNREYVQY
jgi:hypothetical protein